MTAIRAGVGRSLARDPDVAGKEAAEAALEQAGGEADVQGHYFILIAVEYEYRLVQLGNAVHRVVAVAQQFFQR